MQFFSCLSNLMKSTVVDESLSTNATRVLFQRKTTSLLLETTEWETYSESKYFTLHQHTLVQVSYSSTHPYSTVIVFILPSGSSMLSSTSLGGVSDALSLTDPLTLPLAERLPRPAPGGWVVCRAIVDVILLLSVTAFILQILNHKKRNY